MSDIKFDIELKLKELEEIVAKMNDESTSIDENLELYKQGKQIVKQLTELLENAKETVEQIITK
ncbi:MAG: exodeoxyribonuclease VII small subunit [Bacilli bacterium]|nr:exodeoxyribonuclease VII small subunit [Bacilli bacterium]